MNFEWEKVLETGIPALDAHHQGIFGCINEFFQKCSEGAAQDEVMALIDSLDNYSRQHFTYEERLQDMNNYEGLAEQKTQHALFLADVADLRKKLEVDGASSELALIAKGKLIRWFS